MIKIQYICDHCKRDVEYNSTGATLPYAETPTDWECLNYLLLCKGCIRIAREGAMEALGRDHYERLSQ